MLTFSAALQAKIIAHARSALPEECCGALIGLAAAGMVPEDFEIKDAIALPNSASENRPTRYVIDPREILQVDKQARSRGLDVIGFYHSHPKGPARPSLEDARLAWPGIIYLIAEFESAQPILRAWHFIDSGPREIPLQITPDSG